MKKLIIIGSVFFVIQHVWAAENNQTPDLQFRIPLYVQYIPQQTNTMGSLGVAARVIFSDITVTNNGSAMFLAVGPLWQYGERGSVVEILGGARVNEDGYYDPLVNILVLDRSFTKLNLMADIAYFPREERRRLYGLFIADTPLTLGKYTMRYGLESENIISLTGKKDSFGIGPRIVFPLPLTKISPSLTGAFSVGYQYRNDRDFVRGYLSLTYKFGK
ncbi:MAG: hypothetical protein EXS50_03295 [Candidatus Taylorbacteria bacterium]|nr:hypothetical protein [Candidatus Taylorbacteria bacterium]